jgi:hypothetical protein
MRSPANPPKLVWKTTGAALIGDPSSAVDAAASATLVLLALERYLKAYIDSQPVNTSAQDDPPTAAIAPADVLRCVLVDRLHPAIEDLQRISQ